MRGAKAKRATTGGLPCRSGRDQVVSRPSSSCAPAAAASPRCRTSVSEVPAAARPVRSPRAWGLRATPGGWVRRPSPWTSSGTSSIRLQAFGAVGGRRSAGARHQRADRWTGTRSRRSRRAAPSSPPPQRASRPGVRSRGSQTPGVDACGQRVRPGGRGTHGVSCSKVATRPSSQARRPRAGHRGQCGEHGHGGDRHSFGVHERSTWRRPRGPLEVEVPAGRSNRVDPARSPRRVSRLATGPGHICALTSGSAVRPSVQRTRRGRGGKAGVESTRRRFQISATAARRRMRRNPPATRAP